MGSRDNPYANVKKASAVDSYESSGGACGPGYKLEVQKVLGSSCVCADEEICGEGKARLTSRQQVYKLKADCMREPREEERGVKGPGPLTAETRAAASPRNPSLRGAAAEAMDFVE